MKKILKLVFINLLIFFILAEIVSFLYIKIKDPYIYEYSQIPGYLDFNFKTQYDTIPDPISPKHIDTLYSWCTWHPKNCINRQVAKCFDVIYKFNELGVRGSLPDPSDSNTIFFLGDSFAEGYGLAEDSTLPKRLSISLGRPTLNLGTTGDFGSTQMSLVYEEFSKKFKHSDVYVLLYLDNDFKDNDIEQHPARRYRPYRVFSANGASTIVTRGSIETSDYTWEKFYEAKQNHFTTVKKYGMFSFLFADKNPFKIFSRLTRMTYSRRLIEYLIAQIKNKNSDDPKKPHELQYKENDWKILQEDMRAISKIAQQNHARVHFINQPSQVLLKYLKENPDDAYRQLENKLTETAKECGGEYLSFYQYILNQKMDFNKMYFDCDFHFNNYGETQLSDFIVYTSKKN